MYLWQRSYPLPLLFECLLGDSLAGQPPLNPGEEEKVGWCWIVGLELVLHHLELPGDNRVGHHSLGMHKGIVLVERSAPATIAGLFCFKTLWN
jgi:hypothetical protein